MQLMGGGFGGDLALPVPHQGAVVLAAVKAWPGSGRGSGEVSVPAILDGRCARRPLDRAAGTEECSAGAEPKNGKQGMAADAGTGEAPAGRQRWLLPISRSRTL
jgi:hypothetical protein